MIAFLSFVQNPLYPNPISWKILDQSGMICYQIVLRTKNKRYLGGLAIEGIELWKVPTLEDKNQQEHFVSYLFEFYKGSMTEFNDLCQENSIKIGYPTTKSLKSGVVAVKDYFRDDWIELEKVRRKPTKRYTSRVRDFQSLSRFMLARVLEGF